VTVAGAGEGKVAAGTAVLSAVESPTLAEVVGDILRQSDNLAAELLTKELGFRFGGAGTTAAGLTVTRATLHGLGLPLDGVVAADGSGLDRSDRVTCRLLLAVLTRAGPGGPIGAGLPVAGRNGTLWKRFGGTAISGRLRAKTGSLEGVAGLSGWASGRGGETLTFSLLVNGLPREAVGRAVEDRVAAALVAYPQAPDPETLGP
jgi:D-alanyl-D-alanine carboxypeptidase/D-alanyl-D-alanine-endopeptidase (penicillin-binding protein 4)